MNSKQQILIVQGGTSFDNYEDYISYLKKDREVNLRKLKLGKTWKSQLGDNLGEDYEVFISDMPNRNNARYLEWKIWFERILAVLSQDLILIGHSLGGIFLAKYLAENKINKKIKALILVSTPFDGAMAGESLNDFKLPDSLSGLSDQCSKIYLFQSKDDPLVPFEQINKYQKALPSAKFYVFDNKGHFSQETFPEIVDLIKSF